MSHSQVCFFWLILLPKWLKSEDHNQKLIEQFERHPPLHYYVTLWKVSDANFKNCKQFWTAQHWAYIIHHLGLQSQNWHSNQCQKKNEALFFFFVQQFTAFFYVCNEAALFILYLSVTRSATPCGALECVTIPPTLKWRNRKTHEHQVPKHKLVEDKRLKLLGGFRGVEGEPMYDFLYPRPLLCFFFLE